MKYPNQVCKFVDGHFESGESSRMPEVVQFDCPQVLLKYCFPYFFLAKQVERTFWKYGYILFDQINQY